MAVRYRTSWAVSWRCATAGNCSNGWSGGHVPPDHRNLRSKWHVARKNTAGGSIREVDDKDATEQNLQTVSVDPPATDTAQTQAHAAKPPVDLTKLKVEKSCSRGLAGWLAANRISL